MPLNASLDPDLAADLTRWLAEHPAIELGILFGSTNAGRAGVASDLDLAVMAARPLTAAQKKDAIEALAQIGGRPVDLIDLHHARGPLLRRILRTGTRLYGISDARYAELLKRQMFDNADWMPYRDRILEERRQRWIGDS